MKNLTVRSHNWNGLGPGHQARFQEPLLCEPLQNLMFSKCPLGESSVCEVALGGDPLVLLKILPFPPNHYKTLSKCNSPYHIQVPIDDVTERDWLTGMPRRLRTFKY